MSKGSGVMEDVLAIERLSPDVLVLDENVRTRAKPPVELVESIRAQGVLAPVIAHRDMLGQVVVTDGQLRVLAAREVKCERIPVLIGPAPGSAENRIMEQLSLNEARVKMSTSDVAQAVQQLSLFGVEASTIARRIGRKREDVESLQKLAKAKDAQALVDAVPGLDTVQLAELAQLAANPLCTEEMLAKAEEALNENVSVSGVLRMLASDVRTEALCRPVEEEWKEKGFPVVRWSEREENDALLSGLTEASGEALDAEKHTACPGHIIVVYPVHMDGERAYEARPGCREFRAHGHKYQWETAAPASLSPSERAQYEKAQKEKAEREERRAEFRNDWREGAGHRLEFAKSLLRQQPAGFLESILWWAMPEEQDDHWGLANPEELLAGCGFLPKEVSVKGWAAAHIKNAKLALYAGALQDILDLFRSVPSKYNAREYREHFRLLVGFGYELLPVDEQFIEAFDKGREELFL